MGCLQSSNLTLLLATLFLFLSRPAHGLCKVTPGSENWPSLSSWTDLNRTTGGRLLKPLPPASVCHPDQPNYNRARCTTISNAWSSSQFHSDDPISYDWQNWSNYSCTLDPSTPCSGVGYPVYVINATTAEHVQIAVNFARDNNLRLNVRSTGHDFLGRSANPQSLSVWVHYMRSINFHGSSFSPQGCGISLNVNAVTVGSGTQMRELYRAAAARALIVVGGSSTTVSVGGYLTGGGHSPLSPLFGMGADQVIQFDIVTADGKILTTNECTNTDLFWAVRGGGPAFGVVTSFTIRAIPTVPTVVYGGSIRTSTDIDANFEAIAHVHKQWSSRLAKFGVGGYMIGTPHAGTGSISLQVIMPNATSTSVLQKKLAPILSEMASVTNGSVKASGFYSLYQSYGAFIAPGTDTNDASGFPGTGLTKLITSWLYDEDALNDPGLKNALMGASDSSTLLFNDFTAGPGTHNPPFIRGGGNAVNPAWRSAIVRPASEKHFPGLNRALLEQSKLDFLRFGESLRKLAPNGGTYGNEADAATPDFQQAFYGSNYERLLSIKRTFDTDGVFWCRTCVGSELWEEDADGSLCSVE
ncbi:FAD-binding domain-containing protein [Tothia fuscella]|uniref:FAD-binding domain-containing protein n=1 Tax=Tothia fuscella TaxID=1048955 RepID=A0A9P4TUN8_9PEZI|nr:FAD-binding domain-containing protein [Tothia fuscella]